MWCGMRVVWYDVWHMVRGGYMVYGVWHVYILWTCCVSMLEVFKGFGRIQRTENAEDGQMS